MDSHLHPLQQIDDIIDRQGLVVIDDVTSQPLSGEAYISPYIIVALCQQGSAVSEYDMRHVEFHAHDMTIMHQGHVVRAIETSTDYKVRMIVMSPQFFDKFVHLVPGYYHSRNEYYAEHPSCRLSDEQYGQMNGAFDVLWTVSTVGRRYREEMMLSVLHTIMMLRYEFSPIPDDFRPATGRNLFSRFKEAVIKHYHDSREVGYYARIFNLTPKYFSTLIKQEIGLGAGEWIERYVTLQAKSMLERRPDLTIQQVALMLGFSEQASLSRFFKNNTGMSPTEYRKRSAG